MHLLIPLANLAPRLSPENLGELECGLGIDKVVWIILQILLHRGNLIWLIYIQEAGLS